MRRLAIRQIEHHLIDIAPAPAFRRVVAFDNRMLGGVKMLGRMFVGRIVATADMPAGPADSQMQPDVAGFQALFAAECARCDGFDSGDVLAGHFFF